jgi:hypothetical protein
MTYKETTMRDAIEELFRMYKVEPHDDLLDALVMLVKHEKLNAEHEVMIRLMNKVDEIAGRK